MDNSVEPASMEKPLTKWVDEMRDVIKVITDLSEENARHRSVTESAHLEYTKVCEEVGRLRTEAERASGLAAAAQRECDAFREEVGRLRTEAERASGLAETSQRERDALREEVAKLRAENDQLHLERGEAGEAAAKLLDEMKELVSEVAHKFQGPLRTSPFAREAKVSHS
jgi:chromosome segregation ATPase